MIFNSSKYNSHWLDKKLSDLGSFRRGKSRHRPRNDPKLFKNGIYPLVQTGEVKQASLYLNSHHSCYNEFGLSQSEIWPKNTLCITIAANIAETALLSYPMCFPDSVVGFNAYQEESSEIFMHYVFTYIRRAIQNSASGSIQDNINIDYLTGLKFKVPLKAYQDKIVSVLSVLDYKIDLNNRINAELEAMAKTLYNYWFVQFDFPDTNGKPYKTSGGKMVYNATLKREIPAGWRSLRLNELLQNGADSTGSDAFNSDVPYTPIDALPMKKMSFGDAYSSDKANTSLIKYKRNDILIGAMRVYFHRVCIAPFDGITRTTTLVLRPNKKEFLPYIYQVCNEEKTINIAAKISVGTQQPYVNWENSLENLVIAYPEDDSLIQRYSSAMGDLVKRVISGEKESSRLKKLREWLLPLLMNGQVTVK
ncbi:TPA: restriction endonuclease subunit S [Klebsiella pneumoniae subsp. pneumoniae]|uniref:restriction endonuclease subunit S n=1 Tax=Enterobacteriaceae TaxID=543 RepID=UPI00067C9D44|nr:MULTISPECIES: restriction endonuclease subunit S [Enterobacteriaceae]HDS4417364.1 restriction endonuclease subunit S [Klebsiella pneumoniae subsp. pneumoniae]MBZ7784247.1 restriction endonuclease subunit S [Klebsiella pneumoniae]MBZ7800171.1 restriction endonuclease subunit S [Klebsiella pneumoniae]MCM7666676.1 restriction endonuclease subunit S [Enterobacter hormaechei]MDS0067560.1 restriction endonuclease subunit S [Enterobacter hormaechei subsp. xiangfangensis]